jgi:AraC family transcriptional activator of pobA
MDSIETILDFHRAYQADRTVSVATPSLGRCHIYGYEGPKKPWLLAFRQRTFYKVYLHLAGMGDLHYAGRSLRVEQPALVFTNPLRPYAANHAAGMRLGICCMFNEEFWQGSGWATSSSLTKSPLFQPNSHPILPLAPKQAATMQLLFGQLMNQAKTSYAHHHEVLHNYTQLILHEALEIEPQAELVLPNDTTGRVVMLFLRLLGRQFPLVSAAQSLPLRTPKDYADALLVHVNHLNRVVRDATGKTTSQHLSERLLLEATDLLQHSNWSIADIADALGFAYPSYFNKFFKKHTGCTPLQMRQAALASSLSKRVTGTVR